MNNKKLAPMAHKKPYNPSKKGMHTFNKNFKRALDHDQGKVDRKMLRKIKNDQRFEAWI